MTYRDISIITAKNRGCPRNKSRTSIELISICWHAWRRCSVSRLMLRLKA